MHLSERSKAAIFPFQARPLLHLSCMNWTGGSFGVARRKKHRDGIVARQRRYFAKQQHQAVELTQIQHHVSANDLDLQAIQNHLYECMISKEKRQVFAKHEEATVKLIGRLDSIVETTVVECSNASNPDKQNASDAKFNMDNRSGDDDPNMSENSSDNNSLDRSTNGNSGNQDDNINDFHDTSCESSSNTVSPNQPLDILAYIVDKIDELEKSITILRQALRSLVQYNIDNLNKAAM